MSYSYERFDTQRRRQNYGSSSRRSAFGYWVPLVVTVTAATIGLAAWIWKERGDEEEHDERRSRRDDRDGRPPPGYSDVPPGQSPYPPETQQIPPEDPGLMARMSGALRRTPSPQQFFNQAGRQVSAGMAAAGAAVTGAVGGALGSIREDERMAYEDHSRWSEEAAVRASGTMTASAGSGFATDMPQVPASARAGDSRKTVAIVVSADASRRDSVGDSAYFEEHASILSHLPEHVSDDSRVFIMIYAPDLKQHPLASSSNSQPATSLASSYSNIGHDDAQEGPLESDPLSVAQSGSPMFTALYNQARVLVDKPSMIMPFTTPGGYVHLLRHISPDVVYVQVTLSGDKGDAVKHISGWVGQVVLVVGDEGGHGGLVDSEDERGNAAERAGSRWWQDDPSIGLGKGMEVVEGMRVGEDWRRRVRGRD